MAWTTAARNNAPVPAEGRDRATCPSVYASALPGGRRQIRRLSGVEGLAAFGGVPPEREDGSGFRCRIVSSRFGSIDSGIVKFTRHAQILPGDNFGHDHPVSRLIVLLDGIQSVSIDGKRLALTPGAGILVPGDVPVSYEAKTVTTRIHIDIAADDPALGSMLRHVRSGYWPANNSLLQALGAFIGTLLQRDDNQQSRADRTAVASTLEALICSTISSAPPAVGDSEPPVRYHELALQYIRAHHTNPLLTPDRVARELGLSLRTLQRAFVDDMPISQWIAHFRVEHALAFLRDPQFAGLTLAEIATRAGFGSTMALRRAVQAATGLSPSPYRESHLGTMAGAKAGAHDGARQAQSDEEMYLIAS